MSPVPVANWWYLDDDQVEPLLTGLLDGDRWWIGLVVALVAGALHALGPGHGKTIVGAYLASGRGRLRDAGALGASVAVMHTTTVLVVAVASYGTTGFAVPEPTERLLRLVSALAVMLVGCLGLRRARHRMHRMRRSGDGAGPVGTVRAVGRGRHRADGHRTEGPAAGAGAATGHTHHLPGVAPLSRTGITAIATSGGLLPSPGAFVLLATALALGRAGYGLALVAAFGLGLAATLTAVGAIVVLGRDRLVRRRLPSSGAWLTAAPVLGNSVVVVGGLGLALVAIGGQ